MELLLTSLEAKQADKYTISKLKKTSKHLMNEVGFKVFEIIKKRFDNNSKILVVCGSGGNGGDGYVIAQLLVKHNYSCDLYQVCEPKNKDTISNAKKYKGKIITEIKDKYDLIVDAIYGTGCDFKLPKEVISIINKINNMNAYKISVDVPSGLNATNGTVVSTAVKCNLLIAIQFLKTGYFLGDSVNYYDDIEIIDVGIKTEKKDNFCKVFSKNDYINLLPKRQKISNKGNYGRCAIIGGSPNFLGAPILSLSAFASLRVGAGYSTLCIPDKLYKIYALKYLENTYVLFNSTDQGNICYDEVKLEGLLKYDAIAIGMGIGISKEVYKIISYLLEKFTGKLLIDADGLNSIARFGVDILKKHSCEVILTPHILEFARLNKSKDKKEILDNELEIARDFSKKYDLCLVLKSNVTLITYKGETILNINGNPSLAKGGSGDVLSGIILGLIAKSKNLIKSVAFGCYILGRSADMLVEKINENSIVASEIINNISNVLNEI